MYGSIRLAISKHYQLRTKVLFVLTIYQTESLNQFLKQRTLILLSFLDCRSKSSLVDIVFLMFILTFVTFVLIQI